MSDDPIKAALDAARHAALRCEIEKRIARGDPLWRDTPPALVDECVAGCMAVYRQGHAWSEIVDPVPAAIAAFLDALPAGMLRWGTDSTGYDPDAKPTLKQMAAAVRRGGGGA